VGIIVAGALMLGGGIIAGNAVSIVIAALLIVIAAASALGMPRMRESGGISFGAEFPEHTVGPRATTGGHSGPPIDTQPDPAKRDTRRPEPLPEMPADGAPALPDDGRVFPQYVNLAPDERLRWVGGHDVIETPPPQQPDEDAA
jgi:hypothetical protein